MALGIPKPQYKKARKRKQRQAKALDRETQLSCREGEDRNICSVGGHWVEQTCLHHVIRRSHQATRHDPDNLIRLCYNCHSLFHSLPHDKFREKIKELYGVELPEDFAL